MHELLDEQEVIDDATATNKSTIFWTDQVRDNWLQMLNQDPSLTL